MADFHSSVARIHLIDAEGEPGPATGAGFLVAPDLLITCAHTLGAAPVTRPVRVVFPQARGRPTVSGRLVAQTWRAPAQEDVAVLRLERSPDGVEVLSLRSGAGPFGRQVHAFGFPRQAPKDGHPGSARTGSSFTDDGRTLLALTEANSLAQGFSGSPVVDNDGFVVAMVTAHPGPDRFARGVDLAYATPAAVLRHVMAIPEATTESPYPGLVPFSTEQARWFHGRTDAVTGLAERIARQRGVIALLGPSGCGKSSLAAAGLVPAVTGGSVPGIAAARYFALHPGQDLKDLVAAVSLAVGRSELAVVDQFEELLLRSESSPEPDEILNALVEIAGGDGPGSVLLILRDDYYPHLARRSPDLVSALLQGRIVPLPDRLRPVDLEEIIVEPASSQGWSVAPRLAERLVQDLLGHRDRSAALTDLPMLALTLRRIWEVAVAGGGDAPEPDNCLQLSHYEKVGGVRSAFASWCDQAYRDLPGAQKEIARGMVTALVADGDPARSVPASRRRRTATDLIDLAGRDEADDVLARLIRVRIINTSRDESGEVWVELTHDTLLEHWPALRAWLESGREQRRWLDRMEARALEWQQGGRRHGLLEADQLAEASRRRLVSSVPKQVVDYLGASEIHERARLRTRRNARLALIALTVVAVVSAGFLLRAERISQRERNAAISRQLAAESRILTTSDPATSALLAVAGERFGATPEARAQLRNLAAHPTRAVLVGHASLPQATFSPDGRLLATVSYDKTLRLWDVRTRRQIGEPLSRKAEFVGSLTFSADGSTLMVDQSGGMTLWNVGTRHQIGEPLDDWGPAALSPDGTVIAVNGYDKVKMLDATTHRQIGAALSASGPLTFSPDGRTLAIGGDGRTQLWNVRTHHRLGAPLVEAEGAIQALAFSRDGTTLATAGVGVAAGITVRRWNLPTRRLLGPPVNVAGVDDIETLAFSDDGTELAMGSRDSDVRTMNLNENRQIDVDGAFAISPDFATLAAAGEGDTIELRDVSSGREGAAPFIQGKQTIMSVTFSPDGRAIATAEGSEARLWDAASGDPIGQPFRGHTSSVAAVLFSPDGTKLATASLDGTARLWDVRTHRQIGRPMASYTDVYDCISFSPDGTLLATTTKGNTARVWSVATQREVGPPFVGHTGRLSVVRFSPDGSKLATTSYDQTVRLWDVRTHRQIGTPMGGPGFRAGSVSFTRDGTMVTTGDAMRLWDVDTHRQIGTPMEAGGGAVFSPDGATLAAVRARSSVLLFDVATHQTIGKPLLGHKGFVVSWAFSPDGTRLATAGFDGTVRLWDVRDPADPMVLACGIASRPMTREEWAQFIPPDKPYQELCR